MNKETKEVKTVDIIAISDFHGEIEAPNEYPVSSALYNLIKKIKDNNPDGNIVLGVGDMFDNLPMSKYLNGIPARKVLEKFGMEITAIGNHEFLWDMDIVNNVTVKDASFSFVCANMFDKNTGELVYQPYRIFDRSGLRIAVISAAVATVSQAILNKCPEKYYTIDGITEINRYVSEIRAEKKADIVLALLHEGGRIIDGAQIGDIFDIAKDLEGVDAVYAGHSHSVFITSMNGMHMCNGDARGRGFIHTRITMANDGTQPEFSSEFVAIGDLESDPNEVELNEDIVEIIKQAKLDSDNIFTEVVGYTDRTITKTPKSRPYGESESGNWICDVLREKIGADVAIHSYKLSGDVLKGNITTGGLFYTSKRNVAQTMKMKLKDLKEVLENAFRDEDPENNIATGEGIHVSGLKLKYDMTRPSMNRIVEITREDGSPFDENKPILVALNNRMINKKNFGDVDFNNPEFELKNTKKLVIELLAQNLKENNGTVKFVLDNRIENINGSDIAEIGNGSSDDSEDM